MSEEEDERAWGPPAAAMDGLELAPLVRVEEMERLPMSGVDAGIVDFVVKCTEGLFAGRFLYVNRAGELFGSDKDCEEITMRIGNADLAPQHAKIAFNVDTYQYFLSDVASDTGTWVGIRWNRSVEVSVGQEIEVGNARLVIVEGSPIPEDEEVKYWLSAYRLPHVAAKLHEWSIKTLADIRATTDLLDIVVDSIGEAEEHTVLNLAISEIDRMFPEAGYPRHRLKFCLRPADGGALQDICEVAWAGGTLSLAPDALVEHTDSRWTDSDDSPSGVVPGVGWDGMEYLKVGYSFGRYYVHLRGPQSVEPTQKGWVRLQPNQSHWLRPQDYFRIGALQFQVLRFNVGRHSEQGRRPTMEDDDLAEQDLAISNWRHCSLFAVYDGHGGRDCVEFVRHNLHLMIVESLNANGGLDKSSHVHGDVFEGLEAGFRDTDSHFLRSVEKEKTCSECGSTAVVVLIIGGWLWCANVGDSRALLCRGGKAIQLSLDHKPNREDELARIQAAGGMVSFGRVLGRLALSRAFGDKSCKSALNAAEESKPLVTSEPEIRLMRLTPNDEFILLACDGLFDVLSCQEAVDLARSHLSSMPANEQDPESTAKELIREAIQERGSRDNVTVMIIMLTRNVGPAK